MEETAEHHLMQNYPGSEMQKLNVFFHKWNIDIIQIQQIYENSSN
jgi:hypothetical protein